MKIPAQVCVKVRKYAHLQMTVPFPNTYWEPERQEQKEADLHLSVKNWWKSFNLFFQIKKALGEESL